MKGIRQVGICRNLRDMTSQNFPASLINNTGCTNFGHIEFKEGAVYCHDVLPYFCPTSSWFGVTSVPCDTAPQDDKLASQSGQSDDQPIHKVNFVSLLNHKGCHYSR